MTLKIFGAGMAGLLAARILRHRNPIIFEAQATLPHNHAALLRFRSNAVSEVTGIPFTKVRVQKAVWSRKRLHTTASLLHNNLYSLKVTGRAASRSILNLEPVERYIAPPDFIARLAEGLEITYGAPLGVPEEGLSTIPMPELARILGVSLPVKFEARKIWTLTLSITKPEVDIYQTVYFPDPHDPLYRASFTGSVITLEYIEKPNINFLSDAMAMIENAFGIEAQIDRSITYIVKSQRYGKILPIDEEVRRSFIMYATDKYKMYSVGRFATWRQIILDDVVNDVRYVDGLISQIDRYGLIKTLTAT